MVRADVLHSFTLPAGSYRIGDPCFSLSRRRRDILWPQCESDEVVHEAIIDGKRVLVFHLCGDGDYEGSDGFTYSVDTARIAAVPVEIADGDQLSDCQLAHFEVSIECALLRDEEGCHLKFGDIQISVGRLWVD